MHTHLCTCQTYLEPAGRIILGAFFLLAGISKFTDITGTAGYIDSIGLPMASTLAIATAVFETVAGLALIAGRYTQHAALLLAGFTLLSGALFHGPGSWADSPTQQIMFMKNMAIMGGLLFMSAHMSSGSHRSRKNEPQEGQEENVQV